MNQKWDPAHYEEQAGYVPALGQPLVDLLDPKPGERILDLGCGDGELTARIAAITPRVVGVDSSEDMVEAARRRGLTAFVVDGRQLDFQGEFDAVFSNAALHWMQDARAVVSGVRRALRGGGRFVAECGGHGNIGRIAGAIERVTKRHPEMPRFENPWYFPRPGEYRQILEDEGFRVEQMDLFERPTPLEHGIRGWLEVFARHVTDPLDPEMRELFYSECESELRAELYDEEHGWWADYVRLRFKAGLPSAAPAP
jgi:2-isopropylmalate synthase